jgi:tetratricopeptide (TPR) repeat protein
MSDGAGAAERGDALLDLGRAIEAEKFFREALAADPANADLLVSLARSLHLQERYGEARDAARQGLAASPDHLGGLLVLSAALAGLEDFPAALAAVRRGVQMAPGLAQLHAQEGALLIAQGDSASAFGPLELARTLDPEDSGTVALISAALFNTRQFAEAERAATDALRLDPDNSEAHRILGLLSLRRGGGRTAVDAHRTALRLDPTDPEYREGLATAMKSRNPLYGLLLRFGDWQEGLPPGAKWLVLLAPFFASRVLRPFDDQVWAQILLVLVFGVVLLSWALEPVMNSVLLCSSYARNLLPRETKLATYGFLAYTVLAVASVAVGIATSTDDALLLALGLAVWSVSAGSTHLVAPSRRKIAIGLQGAGALLAVWAGSFVALGSSSQGVHPGGLLVVSGVAMIWFTALA